VRPCAPKGLRLCRRCGKRQHEHKLREADAQLECEDGRTFLCSAKRPGHASQSFSQEEVVFMKTLLAKLAAGSDCRVLARSAIYGRWMRKINGMHAKIVENLRSQ